MIPRVPATCLACGAAWTGGAGKPGDKMRFGRRVFYECGASLSIAGDADEQNILEGAYLLLFKNCEGEKKSCRLLTFPYCYSWKNNSKRARFFGRRCRIVSAGKKNTVCIEFENGERTITSRRALRKEKQDANATV